MTVPVVMIFNGPSIYGWDERFYYNGPTDHPSLNAALADLITARAACLTSNCSIVRLRVATGNYRNPYILNPNAGSGTPGNETPPTAVPEAALLLLLQGNPSGVNRSFLRGIPDRIVTATGYAPDSTWNMNLGQLFTLLENGMWSVAGQPGGVSPMQYVMAGLTPISPRGYTFTYTLPMGGTAPTVGQVVRVHSTIVPGYAGLKLITNIDPGPPIVVTVGGAAPGALDTAVKPYFTYPIPYAFPIQTIQPDGITSRKPGRPFSLRRGRGQTVWSLRR